jgi:phage gp29-like protein
MASPFSRAAAAIPRVAETARAAWDAATTAWARTKPATTTGDLTIPAPWQERDPAILGNRLTPTALAGIIRERNEGHFQRWVDLGAEFLGGKNPHLLAQLGVRRASVSETRFEVKPGKGSNGRGARRAAADFAELMDRWRARQEWDALLGQITMAEWWGRSLHEVLWSDEAGFEAPEHLAWVHPRRLSYACPLGDPEPWTIRIHDPDDPSSAFSGAYGVPVSQWHPDKFVLHETAPLGVQKTGEGLLAGVIWYLLMYEWSWRDLMALVELLGRPGVIGYYAAGGAKAADRGGSAIKMDGPKTATPDEVTALTSAVRSVSGSLRAVLSDTTRVEPLKFDAASSPLQLEAIKHIEGLLSKAVNGTTGVTDIVAGSRAAQQVAWMQSLTYWRYDVRRACGVLGDVARRMVAANPARYGMRCPAPIVWSPDIATATAAAAPAEKMPAEKVLPDDGSAG